MHAIKNLLGGKSLEESYVRLPAVAMGELARAHKELGSMVNSLKNGNDYNPDLLSRVIDRLNAIKKEGESNLNRFFDQEDFTKRNSESNGRWDLPSAP
jgi:hypothetical protein